MSTLHQSPDEPHLLREIMLTNQALMSVFLKMVGIPAARLAVLRLLAVKHPEPIGVMEIARWLNVNAAAITRQVKEMEGLRLVTRKPDPNDHRRVGLRLTPKGLRTFDEVHGRMHKLEELLRAKLTQDEAATTARVLAQVQSALRELE